MEELLAELRKTNVMLEDLAKALNSANKPAIVLGFQNPQKTRYIYANRQYPDCLWYFWNGAKGTYEPIEAHALTGFIVKIEIEDKEFRGKPDPKLNLHIRADKPYVLQAGLETLFARGLIYTLSKLPLDDLRAAITIAVEPGDSKTEQVLFSKVHSPSAGTAFYASYAGERNLDWSAMARALCLRVGSTESLPVQDSNIQDPSIQDSNIQEQPRPPVDRAPEPRSTGTTAPSSGKTVAPRKVVLPSIAPVFNPLSGQGPVVANNPPIVDTIRQDLRNATTLQDFTRLKKMLSDNASGIGESILSELRNDINSAHRRMFPPANLEQLPSIEPAFDPLSGQGSIVADNPPIVDTIRQDLRNAVTLRDFSRLNKTVSENASTLGESILSKLQDDINLSYKRTFPPAELEQLKTTIKKARENLNWSPDQFSEFISQIFPGSETKTTAHLTMEQIREMAPLISTEAEQQLLYGAQSDYDNIPF